jgi:hypothetical protein
MKELRKLRRARGRTDEDGGSRRGVVDALLASLDCPYSLSRSSDVWEEASCRRALSSLSLLPLSQLSHSPNTTKRC